MIRDKKILYSIIEKNTPRKNTQTKHILFVTPSKSDEHTVYFLKDYVKSYLNDEEYYCTFLCTRSNYSIEEVVKQGDCVITFRKASADFKALKEAHNMLKSNIDEYLDCFKELDFVKTVDEIVILGGSELVFPKKTYSKLEPFKSLENSFHDTLEVGYEKEIENIYTNNPAVHFPISTFMYYYSGIVIALILIGKRKGTLNKIDLFCVDPTVSLRFMKQYGIDANEYYIVEDKRGTRNFKKFDHSSLINKEINLKSRYNFLDVGEPIDFVFGGRLFAENRKDDFNRFFVGMEGFTKKIFTPSTMSLKDKQTSQEHSDFYPPVLYWDLIEELKNARYTLLMRPWTKNDSVSIRLYEALSLGVLPLVADNYDPDSLQIDRKLFADLGLTVSSSSDINRIINSLEERDRQDLVSLLKKKHISQE
jgi:hypothetical protein